MAQIIHVVGNRPQFVKLAVLYEAIKNITGLQQTIIHTGQHSSPVMSDIFFEQLGIPAPSVQLNIEGASADVFTGNAATAVQQILKQYSKNSLVLVYGDTNTTLAAALAARRCGLKLLHFEAGVRNADITMPEEINRILTDRLAQINYCCTQKNLDTLLAEGYGVSIESTPILSGDLMLDAFMHVLPFPENITASKQYIACTIHRAANITDAENLQQIVAGLNAIHQQVEVIVPMHPHTAKRLVEYGIKPLFTIIEPLGYRQMKTFLMAAEMVITDSGGSSREAFFMKKKALLMMENPFWPEILEAGAALACKANAMEMVEKFNLLPILQPNFEQPIFGNGTAAQTIAKHIKSIV